MGAMHGIADVVHELEAMRAEQRAELAKQTALLERIALALEQRPQT